MAICADRVPSLARTADKLTVGVVAALWALAVAVTVVVGSNCAAAVFVLAARGRRGLRVGRSAKQTKQSTRSSRFDGTPQHLQRQSPALILPVTLLPA